MSETTQRTLGEEAQSELGTFLLRHGLVRTSYAAVQASAEILRLLEPRVAALVEQRAALTTALNVALAWADGSVLGTNAEREAELGGCRIVLDRAAERSCHDRP